MLIVAEEAHKTDTGRQRHANEDSYFARSPLFAVADGMGGAQAGEVASRIAAGAFEREAVTDDQPAEGRLERIAQQANREIHKLAQEDSSRAGMGTTLTAAMLRDDEVALGHVGDSRAYVFRDGELKRLTKDHSLVEELRRQGRLTEEQAEEHPQRSIITRALGPEPDVNVDTMTFRTTRSPRSSPTRRACAAPSTAWSTPPTAAAGATTSPPLPSGSPMPTPRRGRSRRP
jgi:serine/threonine protein phosphatase PrpC